MHDVADDPIIRLEAAVSELHAFMDGLAPGEFESKAWGPREVLAHLVFWLENIAAQAEAAVGGSASSLPSGSIDELNRAAVGMREQLAVAELATRHRVAMGRLAQIVRKQDPETLVFPLKAGSRRQQSLHWYISAEARHVHGHLQQLRAQLSWDGVAAADALLAATQRLEEAMLRLEPAPGGQEWGPKEVLAHFVFWHERWVRHMAEAEEKRPFSGPWGSVKKLNALAISQYEASSVNDLLHEFRAANNTLAGYARMLDPQSVAIPHKLRHDLRTLDDIIAKATGHVNLHLKQL